jgi:hypothetical protein
VAGEAEMKIHKRDSGNWYNHGRCGMKLVPTTKSWKSVTCKKCLKKKRVFTVKKSEYRRWMDGKNK